jgi:hypothetical protein
MAKINPVKIPMQKNKKIAGHKMKKIDLQGNYITEIALWRLENPGQVYFDSMLERNFYLFFRDNGYDFKFKPEKLEIIPGFQYLGEKIQAMTWEYDFLLYLKGKKVIVDSKGYANDVFPYKLKMTKFHFKVKGEEVEIVILTSMKALKEYLATGVVPKKTKKKKAK